MTLVLLDLPDDPQAWPLWLEAQLLGSELGEFVEQLTVALQTKVSGPSLDELCGPQWPAVLERGLSSLSTEQLRQLLKHPQRLLELQTRILSDAGPYWTTKLDTPAARAEAARHWQTIAPQLTDTASTPVAATGRSRRRFALLLGTLAASVLIGVGLWQRFAQDQLGWNRRGVLTADLPADQFLRHLAERTADYGSQPLQNAADLERQLISIRRGCDALLSAPLLQLAAADRDWLKERCRAWAKTFDGQLSELRRDARPWQEIHTDTDATLQKLSTALRGRQVS